MSTLRIFDAPLLPDVDGTEKIPTGGRGDYAISIDQIKGHIFQDIGKELVGLGNVDNTSDLDKPVSTAQQAALDLKADKTYVDTNLELKADKTNVYTRSETTLALSNKADLVNGTIPSNQLPSYVDDVVEYTTSTLPVVGESGKIYITTDTNRTWRWSGNQYVEISNGGVSDSTLKLQTPRKIANVDFDGTQNISIPHNNLVNRDATGAHSTSAILDARGLTQQDINDFGGAKWRNKAGGYDLHARVMLDNGDIVKSTVASNVNNPNIDMSGWIDREAEQEKVNTIVNKTGLTEPLVETVDATPFIQALINAMPDGMTLDLLGKTFRVKKNTGFASDYPNGDQPCLVVKDKKNIKLTNGKLIVKEHAQTAIDCIDSNGVINGLVIEGAGNFPPLYGNTGRGEKGEASAGYFNEALYNSGQPRNNSVDTSGYSGGNYGANGFPQWGGGNAATWGVWNGGYIFNIGDGIYLKNSDFKVEACDIYGFNGNGVAISEGSVTLERNKLHDCYTAGFFAKAYGDGAGKVINSVEISNNQIYNIGHPDSKRTDTNVDPGYGVSTSNKGASTAGVRSYKVYGNSFYNCKRKAIDAHHSYFADVYGNRIETCGYGVFVTINSYGAAPKFTNVHDNFIRDIHMSVTTKGVGVDVTSTSTENGGFEGVININSNYLEDIGVPKSIFATHPSSATGFGITVNGIECSNIGNNTIITTENCVTYVAIMDGSTGSVVNPRSIISGNYIRGKMQYGIFARKDQWVPSHEKLHNAGIVANNLVDVSVRDDQTTAIGINSYIYCKVHGNTVVQNAGVTPYVKAGAVQSGVYAFDVNVATRTISNISQPIEGNLVLSDITVSIVSNTTLQITLPALYSISGIYTNEKSTPRTASFYGLVCASGGSYSNFIRLAFASITNGVATSVNISDITAGVIRVFVTIV